MPPKNISSGASKNAAPREPSLSISQAVLQGKMTQPPRNISFIEVDGIKFPEDLPPEHICLSLKTFVMSGLGTGATSLSGGTNIYLPMPKQLQDSHSVGYKQEAIGTVTGELTNMFTGDGGSMTNALQGAALNVAGAIGKNLINLDPVKAGMAKAGVAPNQFLTVMLTGPQFKKHELSWTLSPRNEKESKTLRKITQLLNNSMAPSLDGALFKHPKVVVAKFTNENVLYTFKPAVIENMSINYSPSGAPSFYAKTKAPDAIELRLSLLEIEFWLAGQFSA